MPKNLFAGCLAVAAGLSLLAAVQFNRPAVAASVDGEVSTQPAPAAERSSRIAQALIGKSVVLQGEVNLRRGQYSVNGKLLSFDDGWVEIREERSGKLTGPTLWIPQSSIWAIWEEEPKIKMPNLP